MGWFLWRWAGWVGQLVELATRLLMLALLALTVALVWSAYNTWSLQAANKSRPLWHVCAQCHWRFRCRNACSSAPGKVTASAVARPARKGGPHGFRRRVVSAGGFPIEVSETSRPAQCCQTTVGGTDQYFCSFTCYRQLAHIKPIGHSLAPVSSMSERLSSRRRRRSRLLGPARGPPNPT